MFGIVDALWGLVEYFVDPGPVEVPHAEVAPMTSAQVESNPPRQRLRLLALHGARTNADILLRQVRNALGIRRCRSPRTLTHTNHPLAQMERKRRDFRHYSDTLDTSLSFSCIL